MELPGLYLGKDGGDASPHTVARCKLQLLQEIHGKGAGIPFPTDVVAQENLSKICNLCLCTLVPFAQIT